MRATEQVSRADADGYTLLLGTSSQLVHNIALFDPLPVDLTKTLSGVALLNEVPMVLLARSDAPFATPEALVQAAKAQPGGLIYGSGPVGTTTHITGLLFVNRSGIIVEHVPYPAGAQGIRDLIAGRIHFQFDAAVTAVGHLNGGLVKALAVAAPQRLEALPSVPTFGEVGMQGFLSGTWNSIAVPATTPPIVITRLNQAINASMASAEIRTRMRDLGSFVPPALEPPEVDAYYRRERELWIPIVRATGARSG
jgi:tripartite-type tricarboxylate transporter receptor subunit TctC